jgi:pimeloyl-ACP methyl ester carboxylesterase
VLVFAMKTKPSAFSTDVPVRAVAFATDGRAAPSDDVLRARWKLDAEKITRPVRIAWGTADRLLPWPASAARYRHKGLPHADWVELEGIGHCPQLDIPLDTAQLIHGSPRADTQRAARRRVPEAV